MRLSSLFFMLFFLFSSSVFADKRQDILFPLTQFIDEFNALAEKDEMLTRVFNQAAKEGNLRKIIDVLRTQSQIRNQEIEHRLKILKTLCKRHGKDDPCEKGMKKLLDIGILLQPAITEMRVAMANRPLENEESAGVLKVGTETQKAYMDALLDMIRYYIVNEIRHNDPEASSQSIDIFSLRDLPELSDIPMLPPPPSKKDMRLGK